MSTLEVCRRAGAELAEARAEQKLARAAAAAVACEACEAGVPEAAVARAVGVTRSTVRAWRKGLK